METRFNFQINPENDRKDWDAVPVYAKVMSDRVAAVQFAKKAAKLFRAEVRLTEGKYPFTTSGSYFSYRND